MLRFPKLLRLGWRRSRLVTLTVTAFVTFVFMYHARKVDYSTTNSSRLLSLRRLDTHAAPAAGNSSRNACRFAQTRGREDDALDGAPSSGIPNVLLLSSMGRSGSSFLGGLLNSLPGVFYYFEPLYKVEKWGMLDSAHATEGLQRLLTCNFSEWIQKAVMSRGKRTVYHPYTRTCHSKTECYGPLLVNVCRQERFRVVKTIRTRVAWMRPLLDDPTLNLRIIHLVRDPRGSIISNWKVGWTFLTEQTACDNLQKDLQEGLSLRRERPGKYLAVRYEDMCADPTRMTEVILSFLGYTKMPQSTVKFLKSVTDSKTDKDEYSIQRDTSIQQQKWRLEITPEELNKIEASCASPILQLGFNLFGGLEAARNLSNPLYNESNPTQVYKYDECV